VGVQEQAVSLRAGSENNLPDSIYTYSDKDKKQLIRKTHMKYNADGHKTEERNIAFWGGSTEESKTEYTYTLKDGKTTMEEIVYWEYDGVWEIAGSKFEYVFAESDLVNFVEMGWYGYDYDTKKWELMQKMTAVEFDASKRPTVYNFEGIGGNEDGTTEIFTARVEVTYNAQGLKSVFSLWFQSFLVYKEEFFYNGAKQLIKEVYTDYEYGATDTYEYTYDEKGNKNYKSARFDDDYTVDYEEYYTNFYGSGSSNETILSIQSSLYPNPASDVLYVSIADADEVFITLVNLTGSVVYQQKTNQPVTAVPVESFAKGYYILTVQADKGVATHKVIIR
jgi:hypothetical protein